MRGPIMLRVLGIDAADLPDELERDARRADKTSARHMPGNQPLDMPANNDRAGRGECRPGGR